MTDRCTEQICAAAKFEGKIKNYFLLDVVSGVAVVIT